MTLLSTALALLIIAGVIWPLSIQPQLVQANQNSELGQASKSFSTLPSQPPLAAYNFRKIHIIAIVDSAVGENYFDVKNQLEDWGAHVTTVGPKDSVFSCNNHGNGQIIDTDMRISAITDAILKDYDAIFVPSGGWWYAAAFTPEITEFIEHASALGLLVGSMCVGTPILGNAGEIVNQTEVLCHENGAYLISNAGGIPLSYGSLPRTISHHHIVTGGEGGGFSGGGHTTAPYPAFSAMLLKEALGLSFLSKYTFTPVESADGAQENQEYTHQIEVKTDSLTRFYESFENVEGGSITEIALKIGDDTEDYSQWTEIPMIQASDNQFQANLTLPVNSTLNMAVEIINQSGDMEIVSFTPTEAELDGKISGYTPIFLTGSIISCLFILSQRLRKRE